MFPAKPSPSRAAAACVRRLGRGHGAQRQPHSRWQRLMIGHFARMRNRQHAQALPLKQICAPNLKGASVHHSSRRSLCFAFLFSFLENQAARECGCQVTPRVSNHTRRGLKTRPWNDTQARAHGTKPSDGTPKRNIQTCSKLASNVAFFSAPQLPNRHRLRCSST